MNRYVGGGEGRWGPTPLCHKNPLSIVSDGTAFRFTPHPLATKFLSIGPNSAHLRTPPHTGCSESLNMKMVGLGPTQVKPFHAPWFTFRGDEAAGRVGCRHVLLLM